jgi:hypothetical protein
MLKSLLGMQASFIGAIAIADLVKTTLGPKGMVSSFFPNICTTCTYFVVKANESVLKQQNKYIVIIRL